MNRMPTPGYSPNIGHAGSPVHAQNQTPHPHPQMGQMYGMQGYGPMNMGMQRGMYGAGGPQFMPGAQQGGQQGWQGGVTQGGRGGGGQYQQY